MSASNGGAHRYIQLALGLAACCQLLDVLPDSNCLGAANSILDIVLDFAANLDIHSVPGNERDRIYELRRHCIYLHRLLLKPAIDSQAVLRACSEAISQVCYLLELESIPWATAVETLCQVREEAFWATLTFSK